MKTHLSLIFAALCLPVAQAAYTYIDATPSNTTLNGTTLADRNAGGGTGNYFNQFNSPNATGGTGDGDWAFRNVSGYEDSNYFESDSGSTTGDREGTGNLVTTITLATIGTYDIVVIFAKNSLRDVAAKIGSAPSTGDIYTISNAFNADQSATSPEIVFDGSYDNGRGANHGAGYLAQITTTVPNQAVEIYINGLDSLAGTQDERTQYDGVGFQLIPEPGSALLGLLGSVLLLRRRR